MTASVATGYARTRAANLFRGEEASEEQLLELYKATGERIADTLGELKGAAMKIGQIASQAKDMVPPEFAAALEKLQQDAPPMEFDVIRAQIERELGSPPEMLFDRFEEEPFAAASIGQVHRAQTDDGREVVVKVQYPGVDSACESDLKQLRMAMRAAGVVRIDKRVMDKLFAELRDRLLEELDYTNEAQNVREFRALHADDDKLVVPDVVGERSAQRVLTMTYEPGDHCRDVKTPRYTQETINEIGHTLFNAFGKQIFEHLAVHADPHMGNFAFRPDGTVVMYDFGSVKRLKPDVLVHFRDLLIAGLGEDYRRVEAEMRYIGALREGAEGFDDAFYAQFQDIFARPFTQNGPYDFATSKMHEELATLGRKSVKAVMQIQPPTDTVLLQRVIGGHYWTMCNLGVCTDFRPNVDRLFALPIGD